MSEGRDGRRLPIRSRPLRSARVQARDLPAACVRGLARGAEVANPATSQPEGEPPRFGLDDAGDDHAAGVAQGERTIGEGECAAWQRRDLGRASDRRLELGGFALGFLAAGVGAPVDMLVAEQVDDGRGCRSAIVRMSHDIGSRLG